MTCYFRHLRQVFTRLGIKVANDNKREIDKIIHGILGIDYKNCPEVWKEVKKRLAEDRAAFIANLREAWIRKA